MSSLIITACARRHYAIISGVWTWLLTASAGSLIDKRPATDVGNNNQDVAARDAIWQQATNIFVTFHAQLVDDSLYSDTMSWGNNSRSVTCMHCQLSHLHRQLPAHDLVWTQYLVNLVQLNNVYRLPTEMLPGWLCGIVAYMWLVQINRHVLTANEATSSWILYTTQCCQDLTLRLNYCSTGETS